MSLSVAIIPIPLPNGILKGKDVERLIENYLTQTAKAIKVDFNVTTQTWSGKPKFKIDKKKYARHIKTSNLIYHFVNSGTKAHIIRPKNASALSFMSGYKAKTIVKSISSRAGGPHGNRVMAQEVHHPGTKARDFDLEIAEKWVKLALKNFERAVLSEIT